jgi:hypothetical protein
MRRAQRKKYGVCLCGAVFWPHRSGYCASGAASAYMTQIVFGPPPEGPGLAKGGDDVFAFFEALADLHRTG